MHNHDTQTNVMEILVLLNRQDDEGKTITIKVVQTERSAELVTLKKLKTAFSVAKKLAEFKGGDGEDSDGE